MARSEERPSSLDLEQFEEEYRKYWPFVYRLALWRVQDRAMAEDVTQETFVRAWSALRQYSGGRGTFRQWLSAIALNVIHEYLRRQSAGMRQVPTDTKQSPDKAIDSSPSAEEAVLADESARQLRQAIDKLPERARIVLWMRLDGLSSQEIADLLGVTPTTVRVHYSQAIRTLKTQLDVDRRSPENLRRWVASGHPRRWVESMNGKWGHSDWLELLESLKRSKFWPMDEVEIGIALETARRHSFPSF